MMVRNEREGGTGDMMDDMKQRREEFLGKLKIENDPVSGKFLLF